MYGRFVFAEGGGVAHGESNGAPIDVLEGALSQIQGVTAARVVGDPGGRIVEIHVLATPERPPKQVVRDVQGLALARFGLDIDYRKVSVVQLEPGKSGVGERAAPQPEPNGHEQLGSAVGAAVRRATLSRVLIELSGPVARATVSLRSPGAEEALEGTAAGPALNTCRLVAEAVLAAVTPAADAPFVLQFANIEERAGFQIALVVVSAPGRRGDLAFVGCALVKGDPSDAIARAALDALNRVISL